LDEGDVDEEERILGQRRDEEEGQEADEEEQQRQHDQDSQSSGLEQGDKRLEMTLFVVDIKESPRVRPCRV
jgi:hypothetical protein